MERRSFIKTATFAGLAGSALISQLGFAEVSQTSRKNFSRVNLPGDIAGDLTFSKAEYDRRYAGIRKAMGEQDIEAIVVVGTKEWAKGDHGNIRYLGAPEHMAEHSAMVLPLNDKPVSIYAGFGFMSLPPGMSPPTPSVPSPVEFDFEVAPYREGAVNSADNAAAVVSILKKKKLDKARIGIATMKSMPADVVLAIREELPNTTLVDAQDIFLSMRVYKSDEEILFMRRSGYIADKGLEAMIDIADVGVNDIDVFYAIDKACCKAGGPTGGFQLYGSGPYGGPPGSKSSILFNPRSARDIQKGDALIPEVASDYKGYFTQLTVPVSVGEPSDALLAAYDLNDKVYKFIQKEFRPKGQTVLEFDRMVSEFTLDASDGEYKTGFGIQAGEHEYSFWHIDFELKAGAMAYNQPFFLPAKRPGGPFHIFGDAMIMTDGEPILLHQSKMDMVII